MFEYLPLLSLGQRAGGIWIQKIEALDFKKSHSSELITKSPTIDPSNKDKLTRFVEKTEIYDNPTLKIIYLT